MREMAVRQILGKCVNPENLLARLHFILILIAAKLYLRNILVLKANLNVLIHRVRVSQGEFKKFSFSQRCVHGPLSCNATFQCIHDILMLTSLTKSAEWITLIYLLTFDGGRAFR